MKGSRAGSADPEGTRARNRVRLSPEDPIFHRSARPLEGPPPPAKKGLLSFLLLWQA